jgi:hypothetical protein
VRSVDEEVEQGKPGEEQHMKCQERSDYYKPGYESLIDNWHTNRTLCDIATLPLGDGIVDLQNLIALAEHLFEEFPPVRLAERETRVIYPSHGSCFSAAKLDKLAGLAIST